MNFPRFVANFYCQQTKPTRALSTFALSTSYFNKTLYRSKNPKTDEKRHQNCRSNNKENSWGNWSRWRSNSGTFFMTATLLSMSPFVTIKDLLGIEKAIEEDPIKVKLINSMALRMERRFDEAIALLEEALKEAYERDNQMHITRVCDELANAYYEKGDLDSAEALFRRTIQRLINLHKKNELSPEFIGISLKLADIYAQRGQLENAEIGYKHCAAKQLQMLEENLQNFLVSKGALMGVEAPADEYGIYYTDPFALFGMVLEQYARFLVRYRDADRMEEAREFMDEVMKISYHIYGVESTHALTVVNNFAAECIIRNRFELAKRYLDILLPRINEIPNSDILRVNFHCNYSEMSFHLGDYAGAVEHAELAVKASHDQDERIHRYTRDFLRTIVKDVRRQRRSGKQINTNATQKEELPQTIEVWNSSQKDDKHIPTFARIRKWIS